MKKIVFILLFVLFFVPLVAANSTSPQIIPVSLDLGPNGTVYYDIGFSKTEVTKGNPTPDSVDGDGISLTLGTNSIATNLDTADSLYVYWHITSGKPITISLQGDGPMQVNDTGTEIDWSIKIGNKTADDQAKSQNVFVHQPSSGSDSASAVGIQADGSEKIVLTTENVSAISETVTPGEYTANLTLTITVGN